MSANDVNKWYDEDWDELVNKTEDILTEVASRPERGREPNTIYYSELNRELGDPFALGTPRGLNGMSALLAEVSRRTYADPEKRVMLSAVVLGKKNYLPGPGFFKLARDEGWIPPGVEDDRFFWNHLKLTHKVYGGGQGSTRQRRSDPF